MASKDVIQPYRLAVAQSMGSSFTSPRTNIQYLDRASISANVLTGAPVGTFLLQGRISYAPQIAKGPNQGPATEWMDLAGTAQPAPAAGGSVGWDVGYTAITEIRVAYTFTSGAGTCDVWISAKRSG